MKVVELAMSIEAAKAESRRIQSQPEVSVHQATVRPENSGGSRARHRRGRRRRTRSSESASDSSSNPGLEHLDGKCYRCGDVRHKANKCKHVNSTCSKCKAKGHIQTVCLQTHFGAVHQQEVFNESSSEDGDSIVYAINSISTRVDDEVVPPKIMLDVSIDGKVCRMEHDTGATISSMSRCFNNCGRAEPWNRPMSTCVPISGTSGDLLDRHFECL
jgi:hypothetical protein